MEVYEEKWVENPYLDFKPCSIILICRFEGLRIVAVTVSCIKGEAVTMRRWFKFVHCLSVGQSHYRRWVIHFVELGDLIKMQMESSEAKGVHTCGNIDFFRSPKLWTVKWPKWPYVEANALAPLLITALLFSFEENFHGFIDIFLHCLSFSLHFFDI